MPSTHARSSPGRGIRALLAYRSDVDTKGGAASVMLQTAEALRALGVDADVTFDQSPDVAGYDVVHPFNIWSPHSALAQLRHLRASGVPVVWQPFYLHWTEFAWAQLAIPAAFDPSRPEHERAALIAALADGGIQVNGMTRFAFNEPVAGFHASLRDMLDCVDHICACSVREIQMLSQVTRRPPGPFTVTPHGVDAAAFGSAAPDAFRAHAGITEDFVLCVGTVEPRKNQLMLIEALRGRSEKIVLLGPCVEQDYLELCRARGGDQVVYLERVPRELVASALKAASVHVLPSFAEGSALASMEAAASGCPVVVSNRSSEFEYYGDLAFYCDPLDPASIREAVDEAVASPSERREALASHIASFTWERTALATIEAYRRAIAASVERRRSACGISDARRFVVLAFADEVVSDPSLLSAYGSAFGAADDATLVIYAPTDDPARTESELVAAVEAAGLSDAGPDLLAVPVPRGAADEPLLASSVDGVLSAGPAPAPFDSAAVVGPSEVAELRARAAQLAA